METQKLIQIVEAEDQLQQAQPPSSSSSPAHEFSFTISLHSSAAAAAILDTNKSTAGFPPSIAIDLSPADDIFFHGHLLPLHLLSQLPIPISSPRSSINSLDSFTLPIEDLLKSETQIENRGLKDTQIEQSSDNSTHFEIETGESKSRAKTRSFSLFGLQKWRKGCEEGGRKMKFDVGNVLKRYMRMVRPLLSFGGRRDSMNLRRRQAAFSSFSGNLSWKNKPDLRGRKGECSAPASMRNSPTNSGLLVSTAAGSGGPTCSSDSTMEELQAAIQAAIAHCKNSIAVEDKVNC